MRDKRTPKDVCGEANIPSDMCSSARETRIPSDMCFLAWETHITSDMFLPTWETRIPSDICSPTQETRISSDMCSPNQETRISSDMCSLTWETRIRSDMCSLTRETGIPTYIVGKQYQLVPNSYRLSHAFFPQTFLWKECVTKPRQSVSEILGLPVFNQIGKFIRMIGLILLNP